MKLHRELIIFSDGPLGIRVQRGFHRRALGSQRACVHSLTPLNAPSSEVIPHAVEPLSQVRMGPGLLFHECQRHLPAVCQQRSIMAKSVNEKSFSRALDGSRRTRVSWGENLSASAISVPFTWVPTHLCPFLLPSLPRCSLEESPVLRVRASRALWPRPRILACFLT